MWNKKIVLTISIIVVLVIVGVIVLFCTGRRTQITQIDLKQTDNKAGERADKKIEKKEEKKESLLNY